MTSHVELKIQTRLLKNKRVFLYPEYTVFSFPAGSSDLCFIKFKYIIDMKTLAYILILAAAFFTEATASTNASAPATVEWNETTETPAKNAATSTTGTDFSRGYNDGYHIGFLLDCHLDPLKYMDGAELSNATPEYRSGYYTGLLQGHDDKCKQVTNAMMLAASLIEPYQNPGYWDGCEAATGINCTPEWQQYLDYLIENLGHCSKEYRIAFREGFTETYIQRCGDSYHPDHFDPIMEMKEWIPGGSVPQQEPGFNDTPINYPQHQLPNYPGYSGQICKAKKGGLPMKFI